MLTLRVAAIAGLSILFFVGMAARTAGDQGASGAADLSLVVQDSGEPSPQCRAAGDVVSVTIEVGVTPVGVVGGQFLVQYDPICLDFQSAAPGVSCDPSSPFSSAVFLVLNEPAGQIFYAVGVSPGGAGALGPATLACLTFTTLIDCNASCSLCFANQGAQVTRLSDRLGMPISFTPHCSAPVSTIPDFAVQCPGNIIAPIGCDQSEAVVTWSPPQFVDGCAGPLKPNCAGMHSGGADLSGIALTGGAIPKGVSTFCCMADTSCEEKEACCWTVTTEAVAGDECDDGDECTADVCDMSHPESGPHGCLHISLHRPHGDIYPPGGDGVISVDDILCVLDGFISYNACPQGDVFPCGGDGEIEVLDILAMIDAFVFSGLFECLCPE